MKTLMTSDVNFNEIGPFPQTFMPRTCPLTKLMWDHCNMHSCPFQVEDIILLAPFVKMKRLYGPFIMKMLLHEQTHQFSTTIDF